MKPTVLVIDDLEATRSLYKRFLEPAGYGVIAAEGVRPALEAVVKGGIDVVLTDLRMPEMDGLRGLQEIRAIDADLPVIIVTAYATVETAVEAMRLGAVDYIKKPFDPDEVKILINRALERRELKQENTRLRGKLEQEARAGMIAVGPKMREIVAQIERVAPADVTVLVRGETGTGKERVAQLLHALSPRAGKPFVSLNCCAIPESLLESELFGHEKGAFSGAGEARRGFLHDAADGTLLLDEIGDLSMALQPKLLRVLQSGEYYPVGSHKLEHCRARVLCATNQDLEALVKAGKFRADLYYRINVVTVNLPALRERPEDIPVLAGDFLGHFTRKFAAVRRKLSPQVTEFLLRYPWPGNVRQLRNVIESAVLMASGTEIEMTDLPAELLGGANGVVGSGEHDYEAARDAWEKGYLTRLLDASGGSVSGAALLSGVHRATLYKWLTRHGLQRA